MFDKKVSHLPDESSFVPEILNEEHPLKFSYHKGISCFNLCCKQADVMLSPYDVIRLKNYLIWDLKGIYCTMGNRS
jgi:hypothetical protein